MDKGSDLRYHHTTIHLASDEHFLKVYSLWSLDRGLLVMRCDDVGLKPQRRRRWHSLNWKPIHDIYDWRIEHDSAICCSQDTVSLKTSSWTRHSTARRRVISPRMMGMLLHDLTEWTRGMSSEQEVTEQNRRTHESQ
jgi:hypothetical protein